jgi:hypothetical protein
MSLDDVGSDSFSESIDFACASRRQNQYFQKNCPEYCIFKLMVQ